jgi:hypothetical protein
MVMILLVYNMDGLNRFFRRIYSNPSLLWKAGAGILFLALGVAMFVVPSFIQGLEKGTRVAFAVLLLIYGLFRFSTFYVEYKRKGDD